MLQTCANVLLQNTDGLRGKEGFFGQLILFQTKGESFNTVSAAIRSNKCSQCDITLVLQRNNSPVPQVQ